MSVLDTLGIKPVTPKIPDSLKLTPEIKVGQLESKLKGIKARIDALQKNIAEAKKKYGSNSDNWLSGVYMKEFSRYVAYKDMPGMLSTYLSQYNDVSRTLGRARALLIKSTKTGGKSTSTTPQPSPKVGPFQKNVAAVKEAYFRPNQSLFNRTDSSVNPTYTDGFDSKLYAGNQPSAIAKAKDLWASADTGSKGMVQTWVPKYNGGYLSTTDELKFLTTKRQEYGFQFIYNPGSVNMSYGGMFDVDPGYVVSGNDKFQGAAMSASDSHISFEILLNRMYDMKYLEAGGKLKPGLSVANLYPGKAPSTGKNGDLDQIYNKGTMYDVEFLLKAVTGLEQKTELRGKTADLGFVGAIPAELHLGKSLRYLVTFDSITVNHVIFDSRMVPLFTTVSFSATRIPDIAVGAANGSMSTGKERGGR